MKERVLFVVVLALFVYLAWQLPELLAYRQAVKSDSIKDYYNFVVKYPESPFVSKVQVRIDDIETSKCLTEKECKEYLEHHPHSSYKQRVVDRIAELAWKDTSKQEKENYFSEPVSEIEKVNDFIRNYPDSKYIGKALQRAKEINEKEYYMRNEVILDPPPTGKIAFAVSTENAPIDEDNKYVEVHIMNADGSDDRVVGKTDSINYQDIQFSPNGKWFTYTKGVNQIYVVNTKTLAKKSINGDSELYNNRSFAWGSDNQLYYHIVYTGLYRYNPSNGKVYCILRTRGYTLDHDPSPSPTTRKLAYVHNEHGNRYWLYLLGGRLLDKGKSNYNDCANPIWLSEDTIIFSRKDEDIIMNLSSGKKQVIPIAGSENRVLSTKKDRLVVWHSADNTNFHLYDIKTWREKDLPFFSKIRGIAFSPDGNDMAIVGKYGIYVHRLGVGTQLIFDVKEDPQIFYGGVSWSR